MARVATLVTSKPCLLLASASPRRSELLRRLGLEFRVSPVVLSETVRPGESPWETARRLAGEKLRLACTLARGEIVLAADTVVELDGAALGKPRTEEEAWDMLSRLRGRRHLVHTAVAVHSPGTHASAVVTTVVGMRAYTDSEIAQYVATRAPFDKAGGYGIHNRTFHPVAAIKGSYTNVLGLPIGATARLLTPLGVELPPLDGLEDDLMTESGVLNDA